MQVKKVHSICFLFQSASFGSWQKNAGGIGHRAFFDRRGKATIGNGDIGNLIRRRPALDENRLLGKADKPAMADINISNNRNRAPFHRPAAGISQGHVHADLRGLDHAVPDIDVFNITAARGIGFEAQGHFQVRAVKVVVLSKHIFNAAGSFAPESNAPVTRFEHTIFDDNIPARDVNILPVAVAAGFDGDAIVAVAEIAILDQDAVAGIRVAPVRVGTFGIHSDVADSDIGAIDRTHDPHRRIDDVNALDENIGAADRLDEIGAQMGIGAKDTLGDGHSLGGQLDQPGRIIGRSPRMPKSALSIQCAFAGDGDVGLPESIDERRVIHHFRAFVTREYRWQIIHGVGAEKDGGLSVKAKVHIVLEMYGAGQKDSRRHNHPAPAGTAAIINRLAEGLGAISDTVALSAAMGDDEIAVGKFRGNNVREDGGHR